MKFGYIVMGVKLVQAIVKARGLASVGRSAGGLSSGIGTAVMIVAAAGLARKLLGGR